MKLLAIIRRNCLLPGTLLSCAAAASLARAEVVMLRGGGQLRGELVGGSAPADKYTIKTVSGVRVTLDKARVAKVLRPSSAEIEYEQRRPTVADTVEAQWQIAEWCRKNRLNVARQTHLTRIIELDPDHVAARRALGYSQLEGRWVTQDQVMTERGYVRHRGQWLLPQEIEQLERKHKNTAAEKQWIATLHRWHDLLQGEHAAEAAAKIRSIDDPYALKAIQKQLLAESDQQVRLWYLEALDHMATPAALAVLVDVSLYDNVDEIRFSAIDYLVEKKAPEVVVQYMNALGNNDNQVINRAAYALGKLGNTAAVVPLINVLITSHQFKITTGSPGGISPTFASPNAPAPHGGHSTAPAGNGMGMGGLSAGQSTTVVDVPYNNIDVRDALIKLTGQNFDFDVAQWKAWLDARKKQESLDARRS